MGTYNVPVYKRQHDGSLVVSSGGKIVMQTGALLVPNSETQASHIANATGAAASNCQSVINSILAALQGVGICATS
jgi:hypothetical protein